MEMTPEAITAFWRNVEILESGCWEWRGGRNYYGYGICYPYGRRVQQRAHRVAYMLVSGPIPDGKIVCHSCDNPPCVNRDHLFLGTPRDNVEDKVRKGRQQKGDASWPRRHPEWIRRGWHPSPETIQRGENHGGHKLTADQVRDIRRRYAAGDVRQLILAQEYAVCKGTISHIVRSKGWTHLPNPLPKPVRYARVLKHSVPSALLPA